VHQAGESGMRKGHKLQDFRRCRMAED
jgi:hypothetical protein